MKKVFILMLASVSAFAYGNKTTKDTNQNKEQVVNEEIKQKAEEFASFKLTTDLSVLTEKEKEMLPLLFEAAKLMDDIFWMEAYGDKNELLSKDWDEYTRKFIQINQVFNFPPTNNRNNNNSDHSKSLAASRSG